MVAAQAAVIGTSPFNLRIEGAGHFGRFDEHLAAPAVVIDVVGHQDAFVSVCGAALDHVHAVVLKNDLRLDLAVARRTN